LYEILVNFVVKTKICNKLLLIFLQNILYKILFATNFVKNTYKFYNFIENNYSRKNYVFFYKFSSNKFIEKISYNIKNFSTVYILLLFFMFLLFPAYRIFSWLSTKSLFKLSQHYQRRHNTDITSSNKIYVSLELKHMLKLIY